MHGNEYTPPCRSVALGRKALTNDMSSRGALPPVSFPAPKKTNEPGAQRRWPNEPGAQRRWPGYRAWSCGWPLLRVLKSMCFLKSRFVLYFFKKAMMDGTEKKTASNYRISPSVLAIGVNHGLTLFLTTISFSGPKYF